MNAADLGQRRPAHAYDGLNRDAAIAALAGGHDARGNLTNDGARTYARDLGNRLTGVTGGAGLTSGPAMAAFVAGAAGTTP